MIAKAEDIAVISGKSQAAFEDLKRLLAERFPDPHPVGKEDLEAAKTSLSAAITRVTDIEDHIEALKTELDRATGDPLEIVQHPGQCPHLPVMKCRVKLATFQKALEESMPEPLSVGEIQELEDRLEELKRDLQIRQDTVKKWEADIVEIETKIRENEHREKEIDEHRKAIKAAEKRVAILDAELKEAEARQASMDGDDGPSIEDLDAKIDVGERIVAFKRAFDDDLERFEESSETIARLEREIACWDVIAKELKPGGKIERDATEGATGPFQNALKTWEPLVGEIMFNAEMEISVGPERRHPLQLSTSQRLALGIAIQYAFARILDFPLLCCDAIDLFDARQRANWLECAKRVIEETDGRMHVMGLATTLAARPKAPPPGAATFYLSKHDGITCCEAIADDR